MADAQYFELCSLVIVVFCAAWFRDEHHAASMQKRSSHRSLDWHDGGSEFVLSAKESRDHHVHIGMVWFRTTQYVTMISAERSARGLDWQWSHFFRSLLCLYCVASWWKRYHNDRWGLRSRSRCAHDEAFSFFFLRRGSIVYNYHTCTVSSGDDHHTTMIFSMCTFDGLDGWYLEVFFVRSGSCRCYVWIVWYRDEHHTNGDRHDGSHPRALSVTLPLIVAWLQSKSQCWTLLYLFCMVLWWTPYLHDL